MEVLNEGVLAALKTSFFIQFELLFTTAARAAGISRVSVRGQR
jgi:hypothetical protein